MATKQDSRISDDDLRQMTGISSGEEDRMMAGAHDPNKYDNPSYYEPSSVRTTSAGSEAGNDLSARENEFDAPKAPGSMPSVFNSGVSRSETGKSLSQGGLKQAEREEKEKSLYKAAGVSGEPSEDKNLGNRLVNISRRRKIMVAGGSGGVVGVLCAILVILPFYRVTEFIQEIENKVEGEVDHIVERRAEKILVNYVIDKAGGDTTDYVITGSPLKDLFNTLKSRKWEKVLQQKAGITFEKDATTGVVHIYQDGTDLGGLARAGLVAKAQAVIDDGVIRNKSDFKAVLRLVTNYHRAGKLAKLYKIRFTPGKTYAPPEEDDNPKDSADTKAETDASKIVTDEIDKETVGTVDILPEAVDCVLNDSCAPFQNDTYDTTDLSAGSGTGGSSQSDSNGSVGEAISEVDDSVKQAEEAVGKNPGLSFVSVVIQNILTKLIGAAAAKSATSALPFIGWIDLAATIQHAIGNVIANDLPHLVPTIMKENGYGSIYATWLGYASNIQAGRMSTPMNATLNKQLSGAGQTTTPGPDNAVATNYMEGHGTNTGTAVDPKVGSDSKSQTDGILNILYNGLGGQILRAPLQAWYYTVGKLIKGLTDIGLNTFMGFLMKISGFEAAWSSVMKGIFGPNWQQGFAEFGMKLFMNLFGLNVDPTAKGANMANNLFTGGEVASNYACKSQLGCYQMSQTQTTAMNIELQQEQDRQLAEMPLTERLFSPSVSNSITSNLIVNAPASMKPGDVMAAVFAQISKLPSSIMSAFSPKLRAAEVDDVAAMTGVAQYGVSDGDLNNTDIDPALRTEAPGNFKCPTVAANQFNSCEADLTIIGSLNCTYGGTCPEFSQ